MPPVPNKQISNMCAPILLQSTSDHLPSRQIYIGLNNNLFL